jgi:GNAT superfamily N-acetyltransferase
MVLRKATPEDASPLAHAFFRMMEESGYVHGIAPADWPERLTTAIAAAIAAGEHTWFVIDEDGEIAATAGVMVLSVPTAEVFGERIATIAGVYTWPQWRRRGYSRALVREAIEWCRGAGISTVRLRTSAVARPLYESLGFKTAEEMHLRF